MRVLILAIAALLLTACEDKDASRARNEQRLPKGCRIVDLDYGDLKAAVICDGRASTTSVRVWTQIAGKISTTRRAANVEIGPQ